MRVLILNWRDTDHPSGGGSERYVEQIAARLAARGDDVTICCAGYPGGRARETREGVRFRRAGGRLTVYPHGMLAVLRERPDVVVDVQNGVPFFTGLLRRRGVVLVHHVHREQWPIVFGPVRARFGWWVESWLAPRLYRGFRYVTVSEATRRDLDGLGVAPDRVTVVPNATEPVPKVVVPRNPHPTLCVVSRLVPHKRVEHAVDVTARLAAAHPALELVVVGGGYWSDAIAARAVELGIADRVRMLGRVDEPTKHETIARSWVMLCPSVKEGWGRVVMEAAQHEVPTIAYRAAGGLSEAVQHGRTGLLADTPEELAEHTGRLLADAELRRRFGAGAREYAVSFTEERTAAGFAAVVDAVEAQRLACLP